MDKERGKRPIYRWTCPRRCGWSRSWTHVGDWLNQMVDHPEYGRVQNSWLVDADIARHQCADYYDWKARKESFGWAKREYSAEYAVGHVETSWTPDQIKRSGGGHW